MSWLRQSTFFPLSCLQPRDQPHTYTRDFTLEDNPKSTELWLVCRALTKTPPWHKEICAKDGSATLAVPRSWPPWETHDSSGGKETYSLLCPSQARHCSSKPQHQHQLCLPQEVVAELQTTLRHDINNLKWQSGNRNAHFLFFPSFCEGCVVVSGWLFFECFLVRWFSVVVVFLLCFLLWFCFVFFNPHITLGIIFHDRAELQQPSILLNLLLQLQNRNYFGLWKYWAHNSQVLTPFSPRHMNYSLLRWYRFYVNTGQY